MGDVSVADGSIGNIGLHRYIHMSRKLFLHGGMLLGGGGPGGNWPIGNIVFHFDAPLLYRS